MIRYPGSKAKIVDKMLRHFPSRVIDELFQSRKIEYREPFFGGGAVGLKLLNRLPGSASIWLNDKDYSMSCLWKSVHEQPKELIKMVTSFTPSVDAYNRFKEEDNRTDMDVVRTGFQKLALHQTSFSGLGAMSGGPIGGQKQSSEYNVDCRWVAARHVRDIESIHRMLSRFKGGVRITSGDFEPLIVDATPHVFIYADPPYVEKGGQLYKHNMSEDDHRRLARSLRSCRAEWVLSYDEHPLVRELYSWAEINDVFLTYTIASAKTARRKNSEVVIKPIREADRVAS